MIISCLRKITCVIQKNERRIDERNRLAEQEKQTSQAAQMVSTNVRELTKRFLAKIPLLQSPLSSTKSAQSKPVLPTEIVETLNNTKGKFMELFRVNAMNDQRISLKDDYFRLIQVFLIQRIMMMIHR